MQLQRFARIGLIATLFLLLGRQGHAHFVWLASEEDAGKTKAILYFSESVHQQDYRLPERIAHAEVWQNVRAGKPDPVKMQEVNTSTRIGMEAALKADAKVLAATCQYGIYGGSLLSYYSKHICCDSINELSAAGRDKKLQLEIVPRALEGRIELTVLWQGKPKPGIDIQVTELESDPQSLTTDAQGRARFQPTVPGLVGLRAGFVDKKAKGEFDGQQYAGAAHYATLTFRLDSIEDFKDAKPIDSKESADNEQASDLPHLPEAVASFGAAVHDGWLYVYSGHIGNAHDHSRDNLSQRFLRLKLDGGQQWEELPMETPLQGLPLVAHRGYIYRVGGMNAHNGPDEDEALYSVDEFSRFDPATKTWQSMPSLPEPRSSHDAVVIGDHLYVVGGWKLAGSSDGDWHDTCLVLNLSDEKGQWRTLPRQPFVRRALAACHSDGRLVVVGGLTDEGSVSQRVDIYDPRTETWSTAADMPGGGMHGFGISAWNLNGQVYASGLAGIVYRMEQDGSDWVDCGKLRTPRFFHRLLPRDGRKLLVVGGACPTGHLAGSELLTMDGP